MEYFNRHIAPDIVAILDAAAILEVTEFQLFELAYIDWYGKKARDLAMEKYFAGYMFGEKVPSWVRHFARKILRLKSEGNLDPRQFGVWRRLPSRKMMFFAKIYTATILLVAVIMSLVAYWSPEEMLAVFRQCYFPPCY